MGKRTFLALFGLLAVVLGAPTLAADGSFDLTFGGAILHAPVLTYDWAPVAATVQPDGKVLLCSIDAATEYLFLSRFDTTGRLDSSFGIAGVAATGIRATPDSRAKMAIKADSLIVVAGYDATNHDIYVKQFKPSGTVDSGFGINGVVRAGISTAGESGFDIAVYDQRKILLAGIDNGQHQACLVLISEMGTVDPGFGTAGVARSGIYTAPSSNVAIGTSANGFLLASVDAGEFRLFAACFDWWGDLIPEFGIGGVSSVEIFSDDHSPVAIAVGPGTHIYLAGQDESSHRLFAARLGEWGALDTGFGVAGIVRADIASTMFSKMGFVVQTDGEVIIAGKDSAAPDYYMCRFDAQGLPDTGCGEAGVVRLGIDSLDNADVALVLSPDGGVVLAGQDIGSQRAFAACYTADGQLDRAQYFGGVAYTGLDRPEAAKVATTMLPGGDMILAGFAPDLASYYIQRFDAAGLRDPDFWLGGSRILEDIRSFYGGPIAVANVPGTTDFYLAGLDLDAGILGQLFVQRFHGDGSVDSYFGGGSPVYIPMDVDDLNEISIVAFEDDRVRLAGVKMPFGEHFLVGLSANGELEERFGGDGIVITDVHSGVENGVELAVANNGDLLLAGMDVEVQQAFLMRFDEDGALYQGFGTNGVAHSGVSSASVHLVDVGLTISDSGPVLASLAGFNSTSMQSYVARFTWGGVLDAAFGTGGLAVTTVKTSDYLPIAIAAQNDGKIVLSGVNRLGLSSFFVRFESNGALDSGFGSNGIVSTNLGSANHASACLEIQNDGKIVGAGYDLNYGQDYLVRLLGTSGYVAAAPEVDTPDAALRARNYPNPFNPSTTIQYDVPADGRVTLHIYDVRGALVRTLSDAVMSRGVHRATWDGRSDAGRSMASGSYLARLEIGGRVETVTMGLVR